MTGIQAKERQAPDLPLRPGKVQRREFEYVRHGTQTADPRVGGCALISNFDVVTGQIVTPSCGHTRTEADFTNHIQQTVNSDPQATKWHFVVDCLNIHQSNLWCELLLPMNVLTLI